MPGPFKPFATASRTVEDRLEKKRRKFAANKLAAVTAQTNTSTPLRYSYDTVDRKKALAESERKFELEAENARMCVRLVAIKDFDSKMVLRPTSVRSSITHKPGMFYDTVGGSRYQCIDHINVNQLSNPRSLTYAPVVTRTAASMPAAIACTLGFSLDSADAVQHIPQSRPASRVGSHSLCPPSPSRGSASAINIVQQQQQQQQRTSARASTGSLRPATSGGIGSAYAMLSSLSPPNSPLQHRMPRVSAPASTGSSADNAVTAANGKDREAPAAGDAAGATVSPFSDNTPPATPTAAPSYCRSTNSSASRASISRAGSMGSAGSLSQPLVSPSGASVPALPFASLQQLARHGSSASSYAYSTAAAVMGAEGVGGETPQSLLQGGHAVSKTTIKGAYLAGCNLAEASGGGLKAVRRITASNTAALRMAGSPSAELALITAAAWLVAYGGGGGDNHPAAAAAAAEQMAEPAEDGDSLSVRQATDIVFLMHAISNQGGEVAGGGVVSASLLNAKPAVGGLGVEQRVGGVLRVLFTVTSDALADTAVRWRHALCRYVDPWAAIFDRQEKNRREFSANKLAAVTAQTDTSTPLRYAYDTVDRKKALAEAERRFELEAENARMCARLVAIQEFDSRMVLRPTSVRSSLTLKPGMLSSISDSMSGSMSYPIVLRCFRALLRQAQKCEGQELRRPLLDAQWGSHRFVLSGLASNREVLQELLGPESPAASAALALAAAEQPAGAPSSSASTPGGQPSSGGSNVSDAAPGSLPTAVAAAPELLPLRSLVSAAFRGQRSAPPDQQQPLVNEAFRTLRLLLEQQYMARCSSTTVTNGVRVDVTSCFDSISAGLRGEQVYVFTYRVRVTNERSDAVKVLGRTWTIKNDRGHVLVQVPLETNSVVGQQPLLLPGHGFEYFSGTDINTPAGLQSGALLVDVLGNGRTQPATDRVTIDISPFALLHPSALSPQG
ncbi:hypothetical protein FOA52_015918 [Chlamydomonas sp. UWO 241]|nr:hypothetical protein FOA52_015918 [Chlamydomonas sp. UWO 241]